MNIELKCRVRPITQDGEKKIGLRVIGWCVTKKEVSSSEQLVKSRHRNPRKDVSIVVPCTDTTLNACTSLGNDMIIMTQAEPISSGVGEFIKTAVMDITEVVDAGLQSLHPDNLSRGTASSRGLFA